MPEVRPGTVLIRIQASPLLSYLKPYVEENSPLQPASGQVHSRHERCRGDRSGLGRDVWHLKTGQRVVFSPHFVSNENVEDPAQILIGLTAFGTGSTAVQADWRDGSLAEFALAPVSTITPVEGLDNISVATQSAVLNRG